VKPKVGEITFIAIDGRGGSGKSTLAKWISERLKAEIIQTDDFANWDNPLSWWPFLLEQVFQPIKSGAKTISYARSKWWENHFPVPAIDQPVTPVMILEGVGSSRRQLRDYISLSIFVDTPKDICLQRGINRDNRSGKSERELIRMWEGWFVEEDRYFERDQPKQHADISVVGTKAFEDQLLVS
jgi:uridine kinase